MKYGNQEHIISHVSDRLASMVQKYGLVMYLHVGICYPQPYQKDENNKEFWRILGGLQKYYLKCDVEVQYVWVKNEDNVNAPYFHVFLIIGGHVLTRPENIFKTIEGNWHYTFGGQNISAPIELWPCGFSNGQNNCIVIERPQHQVGWEINQNIGHGCSRILEDATKHIGIYNNSNTEREFGYSSLKSNSPNASREYSVKF